MGSAAAQANGPARRVAVLDFWRGLVLVTIFVNHIPGNLLEHLTFRNFGFSDGAEAFVFIAGVSIALAYLPKLEASGAYEVTASFARRALRLYRVHLTLTFAVVALFSLSYIISEVIDFIEAHGRGAIFNDTPRAVVGVLLLGHQLGYFNILPLYIVLMLVAPAILVLARREPALALAASFLVYYVARHGGVELPSWPEGGRWFFNPFAWQLMLTLGIVAGCLWRERSVPFRAALFHASLAFLAASLIVGTDAFGFWPGLLGEAYGILDLDKTNLAAIRILHFLALAYVVAQLPIGWLLTGTRVGAELVRLGRHGLPIFVAGSFLAACGQILMTLGEVRYSASPWLVGLPFTLAGIAILIGLGHYLDWITRHGSSERLPRQAGGAAARPASPEPHRSGGSRPRGDWPRGRPVRGVGS